MIRKLYSYLEQEKNLERKTSEENPRPKLLHCKNSTRNSSPHFPLPRRTKTRLNLYAKIKPSESYIEHQSRSETHPIYNSNREIYRGVKNEKMNASYLGRQETSTPPETPPETTRTSTTNPRNAVDLIEGTPDIGFGFRNGEQNKR